MLSLERRRGPRELLEVMAMQSSGTSLKSLLLVKGCHLMDLGVSHWWNQKLKVVFDPRTSEELKLRASSLNLGAVASVGNHLPSRFWIDVGTACNMRLWGLFSRDLASSEPPS